jgi:uroporphyrinogen decarboxylase
MRLLETRITPDFESLRRTILRQGAPGRVHCIELFLDAPIQDAIIERYDLDRKLAPAEPFYDLKRNLALHRFLGYDTLYIWMRGFDWPMRRRHAAAGQTAQRGWLSDGILIHDWEDFERYPWPEVRNIDLRDWEWAERNLPDDMALVMFTGNILENVSQLMGYENLCMSLYEQPDLVRALFERVGGLFTEQACWMCDFNRIGVVWGSDDMGFRSQTLIPPDALRELCLPWHRELARLAHDAGKLYFIHSCGQLEAIMDDLIDGVKIDAKHSFEDAIMPVELAKARWGERVALLGGFDMDLLCRASESDLRRRTRNILDACQGDGGYCFGTGNSVADYVPLENFLIIMDEARNYAQ